MKNLSEACQSCGKCCKCLVLPVKKKKSLQKSVMEEWLGARGCDIVKEDPDTMYVMVNQPCPSLLEQRWKNGTTTYSCGIYKSRPEGCRVFDGRNYDLTLNLNYNSVYFNLGGYLDWKKARFFPYDITKEDEDTWKNIEVYKEGVRIR